MESEKINVLCINNESVVEAVLELQENEMCRIIFNDGQNTYSSSAEHFWGALIELRKILEAHDIKLLCKGCARNVYPSPMILDMGDARVSFKMYMEQQAHQEDLVFIFDPCDIEEYATIEEQEEFHQKWINYFVRKKNGGML